jgi:16S rRNA (cytidine1402-2'-O)-methyltransferase
VAGIGTLYIVATPIGNYADLTYRALRILRECDAVIVEERRAGSTLLSHLGIDKPLYEWNEHSQPGQVADFVERLRGGEKFALISDHGTPLIQDPGAELVRAAIGAGARVEPIPGPSAILAALVASGISAARFRFAGRLPPKRVERGRALRSMRERRETLVLIDAPYRLMPLLTSLVEAFGQDRRAAVACQLTLPDEKFVRGTLAEIQAYFTAHPFKGEFVIIVEGNTARSLRSPS